MLTNDEIRTEFDSWMLDRRLRWAPILCDTLEKVTLQYFATFCDLVRQQQTWHPEGQVRQWLGAAIRVD